MRHDTLKNPLFEGCGEAAIQEIVDTGLKSFVTSTHKHRIVLEKSIDKSQELDLVYYDHFINNPNGTNRKFALTFNAAKD